MGVLCTRSISSARKDASMDIEAIPSYITFNILVTIDGFNLFKVLSMKGTDY